MRFVPIRQGVHLPQDSSQMNSMIELCNVDHAVVLVHDDSAARAHHGALCNEIVKVDRLIEIFLGEYSRPRGRLSG